VTSVRRWLHLFSTSLIMCWLSPVGAAQQTQSDSLPDAPSSSVQAPQTTTGNSPIQGGIELFRVLERKSLVFPDLATAKETLSAWDKFELAANDSVAISTIGATLVGAAYGQAIDSPEGYGQGSQGYFKRFGANMARATSDNMFGTFLIASVRHEDPRFYVKNGLSFKQSVKYAAVRLVILANRSSTLGACSVHLRQKPWRTRTTLKAAVASVTPSSAIPAILAGGSQAIS